MLCIDRNGVVEAKLLQLCRVGSGHRRGNCCGGGLDGPRTAIRAVFDAAEEASVICGIPSVYESEAGLTTFFLEESTCALEFGLSVIGGSVDTSADSNDVDGSAISSQFLTLKWNLDQTQCLL